MRSVRLLTLFCIAVGACRTPAPPATDPAADRAAVEQAIAQWFDAGLAAGDPAAIRRGLTTNAAILEDSVWFDRDGFVKVIQSLPEMFGGPFTIQYSLSDWQTTVHGDAAWTSLRNRAVLTRRRGHQCRSTGARRLS